ncbi:MAG: hypothetical protein ABIH89_08645 [Elusimicrobiota bacterium]
MIRKSILSSAVILAVISAGFLKADTGTAAFLDIGVGARAMGLGGAFTAVSDDATASYWNPAGLGKIESFQSSLMFQGSGGLEWPGMEDISPSYQFFNIVVPLERTGVYGRGAIALSLVRYSISSIPNTYIDSSGKISRSTFNDAETAYFLSYGLPLFHKEFYLGGSLKLISQDFTGIDGGSAFGWDADAGAIAQISPRLSLGCLFQKGAVLKWSSGYVDRDSLSTKIGMSYNYEISEKTGLLGVWDLIQQRDTPLKTSAGIEFTCLLGFTAADYGRVSSASLRAGIDRFTIENRYDYMSKLNRSINWNAGAGINLGVFNFDLQIDYTFSYMRLGSKHRVSLIIQI